jgi:hypothetical protein
VKRNGENMTHGESVQSLQSVKLVYLAVLTVKRGLDFFGIRWLWFGWVVPLVRERKVQLGAWMQSKCGAWMESKYGFVL